MVADRQVTGRGIDRRRVGQRIDSIGGNLVCGANEPVGAVVEPSHVPVTIDGEVVLAVTRELGQDEVAADLEQGPEGVRVEDRDSALVARRHETTVGAVLTSADASVENGTDGGTPVEREQRDGRLVAIRDRERSPVG